MVVLSASCEPAFAKHIHGNSHGGLLGLLITLLALGMVIFVSLPSPPMPKFKTFLGGLMGIVFIILMIIPKVLQIVGVLLEFMLRWIFDFKYLLKSVRNGWGDYDGTSDYTIYGTRDGGEFFYELGRYFAQIFKKLGDS